MCRDKELPQHAHVLSVPWQVFAEKIDLRAVKKRYKHSAQAKA